MVAAAVLGTFGQPGFAAESGGEAPIRARGNLEPAWFADLRSEAGKALRIIYVAPEGKAAKKGALVAELDAAPLAGRLAEQRVVLEKARAHLAQAEVSLAGAREESKARVDFAEQGLVVAEGALKLFLAKGGGYELERRSAENQVALAEKRLALETSRRTHVEGSVEAGRAEPTDLVEPELAVAETTAQLAMAKAKLQFLVDHLRGQRIAELKLEIASRKLDLVRARNAVVEAVQSGEAALAAARAGYQMEESKLERLEKHIEACKIHAPRDGTVLYPVEVRKGPNGIVRPPPEAGAVIQDGETVLRLVDRERFQLEVRVPLAVARRVAPGQEVEVKVRADAFPDRAFSGRIGRVRVLADRPRPPTEGAVTVLVDDDSGLLRPGMSATVELP
jgi:HlyD family secretion protein